MITRKKFITVSSLSFLSLLIPGILFPEERKPISLTDVNTLLKSAADLRKQKKYNQAKQIYQQIFLQYPNEIRAYDGMRKTLLSQKNKEWEVILLFKSALLLNPNNIELKQRLYKEYLNASLGNKRVKTLINFNGRLLSDVKQKFEILLQNHPNNKNLQKQYTRISRLFEFNADTQNPNQNSALKIYNKQNFKNFKNRFSSLSASELETKLNTLLAKPFSKDRKQHIRELYIHTFRKLRKEKNNLEALNKAVTYYNTVDKEDPLFLKYIRDLARYQKNYDILITIETQNHTIKNTFWSALALLDAHIRKSEATGTVIPSNADSLVTFLEANSFDPRKKFELITRKIKLDLLSNQTDNVKNRILEQVKNMMGATNPHDIDRMNILSSKYYKKISDTEGFNKIIKIAINPESFIDNPDPLVRFLAYMNLKRSTSKSTHIQNLNKLLNKI